MTDPKTYLDPAEEKMEMAVAYLDESLGARRPHHRHHSVGEVDVQGD